MCPHTEKLQCLRNEAAICGARLLSVSRQVRAHLWHEGPAGHSGIQTYNLLTLARLEVQALPLRFLLLLVVVLDTIPFRIETVIIQCF